MSSFLVINLCTFCLNVERNPSNNCKIMEGSQDLLFYQQLDFVCVRQHFHFAGALQVVLTEYHLQLWYLFQDCNLTQLQLLTVF